MFSRVSEEGPQGLWLFRETTGANLSTLGFVYGMI